MIHGNVSCQSAEEPLCTVGVMENRVEDARPMRVASRAGGHGYPLVIELPVPSTLHFATRRRCTLWTREAALWSTPGMADDAISGRPSR